MASIDRTATVAQIVTEHPGCAAVFERHEIDYCCHGDVRLDEACRSRRRDLAALLRELEAAAATDAAGPDDKDVRSLSVPALIARIVDRHHGYLRTALPFLEGLAAKVAKAHGSKDAKLVELSAVFGELVGHITSHLEMEEHDLFPALMAARPEDRGSIRTELEAMLGEHLVVGDLLRRLRALGGGYAVPDWACNTYEVLMTELAKLESDVLRHIHLENHVLMPRFTE
ncbi:MAG: iron-sulfur cluster repair di-iron protein [Deltaproteobacteria bacterium]|nr:iron-sulfur cluster repair di-iron protein [Deltaproteobacteria bacterium]